MRNKEILEQMVNDYCQFAEVEAIVLGGSSASKVADISSDFDIYIYCHKEPDVEKRKEIAKKYSDSYEIDNHYFETGDVYYLRETKKPIDIMYRSLESIEANIKWVWKEHNAYLGYTTCFVDNVNKSEILFDRNGWFKNLQEKTKQPYPEELAQNIIKKNLSYLQDVMFSYYDQIESAVKRKDYISINHRISAFLASYFDVIFAHNRILHPGEKRLLEFAINNCNQLPKNFEENINSLILGKIETKTQVAAQIVSNLKEMLNQN